MTKTFCDRCGKCISDEPGFMICYKFSLVKESYGDENELIGEEYCAACGSEFYRFLTNWWKGENVNRDQP